MKMKGFLSILTNPSELTGNFHGPSHFQLKSIRLPDQALTVNQTIYFTALIPTNVFAESDNWIFAPSLYKTESLIVKISFS